jgi:hypothetical protein
MKTLLVAIAGALLSFAAVAQQPKTSKIPVYFSQMIGDQAGILFAKAVTQKLTESAKYEVTRNSDAVSKGPKFFIEIASVDVSSVGQNKGERTAVSVVVEATLAEHETPWKWYHKIIIVNREDVGNMAERLIKDMDVHWCNEIRNSRGGCPKEELP